MKKASTVILALASIALLAGCDATAGQQTNTDSQEYQAFKGYVDDIIPDTDETTGEAAVYDTPIRLTREYSENSLTLDLVKSDGTIIDSAYSHLPKGQTFIINQDESYMEEINSAYALENDVLVLTTETTQAYGDTLMMNDYVDNLVHKTDVSTRQKTLHSAEYVNNVYSHTDVASYRNDATSVYNQIATEIEEIYATFYDLAFNSDRSAYNIFEVEQVGNEISIEFERWNGQ